MGNFVKVVDSLIVTPSSVLAIHQFTSRRLLFDSQGSNLKPTWRSIGYCQPIFSTPEFDSVKGEFKLILRPQFELIFSDLEVPTDHIPYELALNSQRWISQAYVSIYEWVE
jgi:hypothetical protein